LSLAAVPGNEGTSKFPKENQQIPQISAPISIRINCFEAVLLSQTLTRNGGDQDLAKLCVSALGTAGM